MNRAPTSDLCLTPTGTTRAMRETLCCIGHRGAGASWPLLCVPPMWSGGLAQEVPRARRHLPPDPLGRRHRADITGWERPAPHGRSECG